MSKIIHNPSLLILNAAKELAYEEGLSNISMRKVASKSKIALGTIYNYYPTKMDIIIAIVEDFWQGCFKNLHTVYNEELDFFTQLEKLYFYILHYLEKFESNLLEDLTNLSSSNKNKGKKKESEYIQKFHSTFKRILDSHKDELSSDVFEKFSEEAILRFIIDNFFIMLKRFEHDYEILDFTLKKMLK